MPLRFLPHDVFRFMMWGFNMSANIPNRGQQPDFFVENQEEGPALIPPPRAHRTVQGIGVIGVLQENNQMQMEGKDERKDSEMDCVSH